MTNCNEPFDFLVLFSPSARSEVKKGQVRLRGVKESMGGGERSGEGVVGGGEVLLWCEVTD